MVVEKSRKGTLGACNGQAVGCSGLRLSVSSLWVGLEASHKEDLGRTSVFLLHTLLYLEVGRSCPFKIKLWCSRSPQISTSAPHCPLSKLTLTLRSWGTSNDLQVNRMCAGTSVDAKRSLFLGSASHLAGRKDPPLPYTPTSVYPSPRGRHRLDPLKPQAGINHHPFEILNKDFHSDRCNWCISMCPGQS